MADRKFTYALLSNSNTGWTGNGVCPFFHQADKDEINNLKPGDTIWLYESCIELNGRVRGFIKSEVKNFAEGKVFHSFGMTSLLDHVFLVDDADGLAKFLADNPLAAYVSEPWIAQGILLNEQS